MNYKYYHPTYFIEKGTDYRWQGADSLSDFVDVSSLGTERRAVIPEDFEYKYIRCIVKLSNSAEYVSDAVEITKAQKIQEQSFAGFSLRDSGAVPCKTGQSYRFDAAVLNIADTVSFTADKNTRVTAEGCSIYSVQTGERICYAIAKNTGTEKMEIVIHTDYDGTLTVREITAARSEQERRK